MSITPRICADGRNCHACRTQAAFRENMRRAFGRWEDCPRGLPVGTYAPALEPSVCVHRGAAAGVCACGARKYVCGFLGIPVRVRRRPGHPHDLMCAEGECAKFEARKEAADHA